MRLFQASDAGRLSGLTPHQLREWCGRRTVMKPDVPAAGRGHLALFSWRTILVLRVLNELHLRFGIEIGAWSAAMAELRAKLEGRPFQSLWNTSAAFASRSEATIGAERLGTPNSHLIIPFNPHLEILATEDALPPELQLPLFPVMVVKR